MCRASGFNQKAIKKLYSAYVYYHAVINVFREEKKTDQARTKANKKYYPLRKALISTFIEISFYFIGCGDTTSGKSFASDTMIFNAVGLAVLEIRPKFDFTPPS